eukprot:5617556-Pyramimonas_sp.AAC.1
MVLDVSCPVRRDLFGGAIEMHLSERFVDISDYRQVPDHQECFADGNRDQSFLVELLDYKEEVSDGESARFFFEDLVRRVSVYDPRDFVTEFRSTLVDFRQLRKGCLP